MKIYVNNILPEGMSVEEKFDASSLSLENEAIHYASPVKVKAFITKDKNVLNVDCNISAMIKRSCDRCLEEIEIEFKKQANFVYVLEGEYFVEIDDNIRDAIMVDYPMKFLCSEDCKGLCLKCGKNLNEGTCGCAKP
ncbi:MAG: DUF177 domain-containing protein [Candidatus Omnitrophota bacterium]